MLNLSKYSSKHPPPSFLPSSLVISTFILTIILNQNQFALYLNRSIYPNTYIRRRIKRDTYSHTDDNFITSVTVHPDYLSDHHRIELTLSARKPAVKTVMIAMRNFKYIETDALRNDIKSVCADMTLCGDAYLTECFDKQLCNVRVRNNSSHSWYDSDIDDAREKKWKLENVWRRTKLEIHRPLKNDTLTVSMCSIQLRTQRSQRFVVLLTKHVYWKLCLLIS